MKSSHVIGGIFILGLLIYFFTRRKVTGTISMGDEGVKVNGSSEGTVSYGTELQGD